MVARGRRRSHNPSDTTSAIRTFAQFDFDPTEPYPAAQLVGFLSIDPEECLHLISGTEGLPAVVPRGSFVEDGDLVWPSLKRVALDQTRTFSGGESTEPALRKVIYDPAQCLTDKATIALLLPE